MNNQLLVKCLIILLLFDIGYFLLFSKLR